MVGTQTKAGIAERDSLRVTGFLMRGARDMDEPHSVQLAYREGVVRAVAAMRPGERTALKQAAIFASKVPAQERDDVFQELTCKLLELTAEAGKAIPDALAYAVAHADWANWWRAYKIHNAQSLDAAREYLDGDGDAPIESVDAELERAQLVAMLVGEHGAQARLEHRDTIRRVLALMPTDVKRAFAHKVTGRGYNQKERSLLTWWLTQHHGVLVTLAQE